MTTRKALQNYPTSRDDFDNTGKVPLTPQTASPSYRLSFADIDFMTKEELRPVRLQLELLKPELLQQEHNIKATVVVFGGSRIPNEQKAQAQLK